jgi:hypothetical protein
MLSRWFFFFFVKKSFDIKSAPGESFVVVVAANGIVKLEDEGETYRGWVLRAFWGVIDFLLRV